MEMKVRFLKRHLTHRPGDERNIETCIAIYLIKMGVVESVDSNPAQQEAVLSNHLEDNKPKKSKSKKVNV